MHCDILTLHLMSVLFCDMIFQDYSWKLCDYVAAAVFFAEAKKKETSSSAEQCGLDIMLNFLLPKSHFWKQRNNKDKF